MGEWPTIFDKSTTLTLSDGRRIFVASPMGLGSIGFQIAGHQTKSMIDALCCAVEGRQDKNLSKMSQLLGLVGGVGASAVNNQNMPRKISENIQMGKLIAFQVPPMTVLPLASSLGLARSLAPTMIDLPSLDGIDINNPDVRAMDEGQRMLWVLHKCGEILNQTGKSEVATAFKQLLEPQVIGLVVAGLIVWGASHFVGVGFIFDIAMVVVMGVAVIKAFETMWDIYKIITKASSTTDLNRAAKMMAGMVIDLGVETFLAIVLKGAAKSRFRAPPSKAAGSTDDVVEFVPSRRRGAAKKSSEEAPKKKADGDGKKATATIAGKKVNKTGHRLEDPDHIDTSWEAGPWNEKADHRYSGKGDRAIYAADSEATALAEVKHWGDPTGRVPLAKDFKLKNALDLTDPSVRQKLGVSLEDITGDSYQTTQRLAKWARKNGFDGIVAPSARNSKGYNMVIFQ